MDRTQVRKLGSSRVLSKVKSQPFTHHPSLLQPTWEDGSPLMASLGTGRTTLGPRGELGYTGTQGPSKFTELKCYIEPFVHFPKWTVVASQ